ncbi:DUF4652 domain-containing protein [Neobacillus kokaensis]|uniref:Uncharacterized protein n=1 Tax=Neobacillus kokaensis TaxID=2759023 RepID=A0ABQ3NA50_9BACI|nr:DUF4652 domain-containing protein [Neobacillus kokaensis]GHH98636.1 hypothetical protein AM1BK_21790 [Neobacillus kokaensis]
MYKLRYDDSSGFIYIVNENRVERLLESHFSSKPAISPDGTYAVYITPLEWEVASNLYKFDLELGTKEEIRLDIDETKYKVKDAVWIDDSHLAMIIGGIDGTIAIGGNIYRYDLETELLIPITEYEDNRKQAIKLNIMEELLVFDTIEYIDRSMSRFIRKQEELPLISAV